MKSNTILSQTRDKEVSILDPDKVNPANARPDAEPTTEQLSGLAVDFAVWGPQGHHIQKKLKLTALQLSWENPMGQPTSTCGR